MRLTITPGQAHDITAAEELLEVIEEGQMVLGDKAYDAADFVATCKRVGEIFGWVKTIAGQDKTRFRGVGRVGFAFTFAAAAYNLVRLPKLLAEAPQ